MIVRTCKIRAVLVSALIVVIALGIGALFVFSPANPSPSAPTLESPPATDSFSSERLAMVQEQIVTRDVTDTVVLDALRRVPRQEFVPEDERSLAYADQALPIGFGQTISQPFIVALMTQLLNLKRGDKVLEVGTGSGYQAAILAELADRVWTVEIIRELADSAAARLKRLGYTRINGKNADGYYGWEEFAPYDAIVVTAAPDHVPPPLIHQLKEGGRLVPAGRPAWQHPNIMADHEKERPSHLGEYHGSGFRASHPWRALSH